MKVNKGRILKKNLRMKSGTCHYCGAIIPLSVNRHFEDFVAGVGVDLIRVKRVEQAYLRRPVRFMERIFSAREQAFLSQRSFSAAVLAVRFAAKEAVSKALGCGIGPVSWNEMEILPGISGIPTVVLCGKAGRVAQEKGISGIALSLSHDGPWGIAFAVAYRNQKEEAKGND